MESETDGYATNTLPDDLSVQWAFAKHGCPHSQKPQKVACVHLNRSQATETNSFVARRWRVNGLTNTEGTERTFMSCLGQDISRIHVATRGENMTAVKFAHLGQNPHHDGAD
jgi:hypothetical protein